MTDAFLKAIPQFIQREGVELVHFAGIAAFRPLGDGDRRKPLDGARGGLLGSSLVLEPTDDEAAKTPRTKLNCSGGSA